MSVWDILKHKGKAASEQELQAGFFPFATMHVPGQSGKSYALEREGERAEIAMYGEIVASRPYDYWQEEPVDGDFIVQSEFMSDLETVAGVKSLTIRMNSIGGDAGVSILIHNRLRELAANGTELTCIVDGVAMSGGSLIMCACDHVQVNPSSLVMIHKCWDFVFGAYNADEFRKEAERCEAWDKAQVSVYRRKTGLSERTLLNMMANTTYMTGSEAVEKGFADTLLENAEPLDISASADRRSLFVKGRQIHLPQGMRSPETIPVVKSGAESPDETNMREPDKSDEQIGGKTMAKTLEEFRAENPELAEQLMAEAKAAVSAPGASDAPKTLDPVTAERERLLNIDKFASFCDAETVREAKYGDNACDAQEMLMRAAIKAKQQGRRFLSSMEADTTDSGAQSVTAIPDANAANVAGVGNGNTPQEVQAAAKNAAARYLEMKEGKRHEQ